MNAAFAPRASVAIAFALALGLVACAGPAPAPLEAAPAPPASAAPSAVVIAAPTPPARTPLGPGEIVCGIDDGPVPIGRAAPTEDDLRRHRPSENPWDAFALQRTGAVAGPFLGEMMAEPPPPAVEGARPEVKLAWTLGGKLHTTAAFEQRAHACGELAELGELASRTFDVQTSLRGGPVATRDGAVSSSKLSKCFGNALCSLGPSESAEIAQVRLSTDVTPPVFRGHVAIEIADERQGPPLPGFGRRRHASAPPPPRPAASQAYAKQLAGRLKPVAEACAAKRPPAQSFATMVVFSWDKDGKRALRADGGNRPVVDAFERCLSSAADALVTRPPANFNPNGRIPIFARVEVEPAPPSLPPPPPPPALRRP